MTDLELAWAAGLFEGEGTIRISKPARRNWGTLGVSVVNTDREVVDYFQSRWPGYMKSATGLGPNRRPAWVWVIAARQAAAFLRDIRPFVVTARVLRKLDHGLWFQGQKRLGSYKALSPDEREAYRGDQWNAYWWMAELNTRGRRDVLEKLR